MAEIALRTTERRLVRDGCLHWRPVGSTIVCCDDHMIRRKWLEICCDLVAPYKRKDYTTLPGFDKLVEAWTPELREAWLEFDRPTEQYKLGQLLMDDAFPQSVWQTMIEPIGVLKDLPFAPESDKKVHDTWLWSEGERKNYYLVYNDDANRQEVQSWQGTEERETSDPKIKLAHVWAKQVEYKLDIGLSLGTLADIADPEKVKNPRHDKPVGKDKIKQPLIENRDDQ